MLRVRYTEWDGSQSTRLSADQVFARISNYLSFTDDVQQALDWLVHEGLAERDLEITGLDGLLEQVRERLRAGYRRYNLRTALDEVSTRLAELLARERERLGKLDEEEAAARLAELAALPGRLSAAIARLGHYSFVDPGAAAMLGELRAELDNIGDLEDFVRRYGDFFRGPEALGYRAAIALLREIERLKRLEEALLAADLNAVSGEELRALLGEGAWGSFENLRQMLALVVDAGYLVSREGRSHLSPRGVRKIGQLALRDIYTGLLRDRAGTHPTDHRGSIEVRPEESRRYEDGDLVHIDLVRTLKRALARGLGTPLRLRPDDFEVLAAEHATTTSTVLLLDMSWSMSWEGRFAAAKKVAMAMESLVRARYPRDYLGIVGFFTRAVELKLRDLPEASWNMGDPFTNLQDGLRLAGELLSRHPSNNRHIIVITDGQPTAYFLRGRLYCEWPLSFGGISMRAAQETLREVERITRMGITINTFMLDDSPSLRAFVERMTCINRGRALYTRPDRLGEYLLVDYLARKRKRV